MNAEPFQHAYPFRKRRFINWFPMGLTYALLYMGRYNLTVSKNALGELMTKEDFGIIFGAGTITYAISFLLNGPLVDKIGGKKGILVSAFGAGLMNLAMGLYLAWILKTGKITGQEIRVVFSFLYAANMYFQSYGAVSIVKVNAHWFHVRERGGFSGIFGTMISSGIFLAFTVNGWILDAASVRGSEAAGAKWVFYAPASLLFLFFLIECYLLKDKPSQAGFNDFDTMDASSGEEDLEVPVLEIMKRILTNPIILTVAFIEFCTGVIRNGVMHWFPIYAKEVWILPSKHYLSNGSWGNTWIVATFFIVSAIMMIAGTRTQGSRRGWFLVTGSLVFLLPFLQGGWGGILFVAGVIGANVAGWISDLVFASRRAPVAGILYGLLTIASIGMFFALGGTDNRVGWSTRPTGPLQAGDRITSIEGKPVTSWSDVDKYLAHVIQKDASRNMPLSVSLDVHRVGSSIDGIRITLFQQPDLHPAWGLLPRNSAREAAASAQPEIMAIAAGDEIIGIAGTPEKLDRLLTGNNTFTSWNEVTYAVSAVPARCVDQAHWNPDKRMCTYDGTGIPEGDEPSTGFLYARIRRDGQDRDLMLRDPTPTMRAGDKRAIQAGPVLRLDPVWLGLIVFIMSISVIGTHGLLSGTATMDFGGRKGAATAVGMIDGFVYLGTGFQSLALGYLTTWNWSFWPAFLFPFGIIGFLLLRRIWDAIPTGNKQGH